LLSLLVEIFRHRSHNLRRFLFQTLLASGPEAPLSFDDPPALSPVPPNVDLATSRGFAVAGVEAGAGPAMSPKTCQLRRLLPLASKFYLYRLSEQRAVLLQLLPESSWSQIPT
jgi:hypothetical protein